MASADQQLLGAAEVGDLDAVEKAITNGADIEAVESDGYKRTALMRAAEYDRKDVVQYIISQGANTEAQDWNGWTALWWATINGHDQIVKALLSNGANMNTQDNSGWTALMWACINGHDQIAKALLSNGANMNTQSNDGQTAIMKAAECGNKAAVEVLITHGADVSIKNNDGQTALDLANKLVYPGRRHDYSDIIELLCKPPTATPTLTTEEDAPKVKNTPSTQVESPTPEIASVSTSSLSISFISALQNEFKITDEQIDRLIEERYLFYLGQLFRAWRSYAGMPGLGLSDGEQHNIHADRDLIDNQKKMLAALKIWQRRNPLTATFRNLLSIVLELNDLRVAKIICQYISKPSSAC